MIEQIPIFAPPIVFPPTLAAGEAAKCVLRLEDLLVGYGPLPDVVRITRLVMSNEGAGDYPAGCSGKIDVAVDPHRRFIVPAQFPARERLQPKHPKLLGSLQTYPGRPKLLVQDHSPVIGYRKATDRIIVAPNIYGDFAGTVALYLAFYIESDFGDWPLDPRNVFLQPITATTGSAPQPTHCFRSLIPSIPHGGTKVRVHNNAHEHGCNIVRQSIGIQAAPGSPDMIAPPVPLLCDGVAATLQPSWGEQWREADLVTYPGQSLIINTTVSGAWGFADGGPPSWFSADADSYASAPMLGTIGHQPSRTHCIDCVQVM